MKGKVIFDMTAEGATPALRIHETELLNRALECDIESIQTVLSYLGSTIPHLCQIMQETIHSSENPSIWKYLLDFFALRKWDCNEWNAFNFDEILDVKRIDQSIIEVFVQDKDEIEKITKSSFLHGVIHDPTAQVRHATACLLGLKGEIIAIPILEEAIEIGTNEWKLRSIKALAVLKDERCGPPLFKALTMDKDRLHREARRALLSLGRLAEPVWIEALNHPDKHIRWEAARGLGNYGNTEATHILAEGLFDGDYAVRWATTDVLAQLGEKAVPAILSAIIRNPLNEPSRQASYHALHGINSNRLQERIKPLLDALNKYSGSVNAPAIAQSLLLEWESNE